MKSTPLGRRPRKTREEIYQAAIELFMRHGALKVTMQEIADSAETARSTVFNHYPSKKHLYEVFFLRFVKRVLTKTIDSESKGLRATLYVFFEAVGVEAERFKPILRDIIGLTTGEGVLKETDEAVDEDMIKFFSALVSSAIEDKEIGVDLDVMETAGLILSNVSIVNHEWVKMGQTTDLSEDHKKRFELLFRGLAV